MGQKLNCTDCLSYYMITGCTNEEGTGNKESCPHFVDSIFGDQLDSIDFVEQEDGSELAVDATLN